MNDYISRQAAIDVVDNVHQEHLYKQIGDKDTYTSYNEGWADACDRIDSVLRGMPSADAVEVVRCKDCLIHGLCRFEQGLGLDGFCSKGERKDG